jgi:uncharacterized protein YcaQ
VEKLENTEQMFYYCAYNTRPGEHPMATMRTISPTTARRLAIARQRLAGPKVCPDADGMLDVVRDLGCLQLDPISAVARSHQLVLWSRLGNYDLAHLDTLLWKDRRLFEYWAHAASIVLTENYHLHSKSMRKFGTGDSNWAAHVRNWLEENHALEQYILDEIRRNGPMLSRQFDGDVRLNWQSGGWNSGRNVSRMLDFLWTKGTLMVAGRSGGQKLWDLTERCLPDWTPRDVLSEREVVRRAAQISLRALGVATPAHIKLHFMRYSYTGLPGVLTDLEREGAIERVQLAEEGADWPGPWYIHRDDLPLLESLEAGEWQPRTTLLSPFDNLICDRARTEQLFNFNFRIEIYVPKDQRKYGYYVLPILHGDTLIGRLDPLMDRKNKRLTINAIYPEPGVQITGEAGNAVRRSIEDLAAFLGAKDIAYGERAVLS